MKRHYKIDIQEEVGKRQKLNNTEIEQQILECFSNCAEIIRETSGLFRLVGDQFNNLMENMESIYKNLNSMETTQFDETMRMTTPETHILPNVSILWLLTYVLQALAAYSVSNAENESQSLIVPSVAPCIPRLLNLIKAKVSFKDHDITSIPSIPHNDNDLFLEHTSIFASIIRCAEEHIDLDLINFLFSQIEEGTLRAEDFNQHLWGNETSQTALNSILCTMSDNPANSPVIYDSICKLPDSEFEKLKLDHQNDYTDKQGYPIHYACLYYLFHNRDELLKKILKLPAPQFSSLCVKGPVTLFDDYHYDDFTVVHPDLYTLAAQIAVDARLNAGRGDLLDNLIMLQGARMNDFSGELSDVVRNHVQSRIDCYAQLRYMVSNKFRLFIMQPIIVDMTDSNESESKLSNNIRGCQT